MSCFRIGKINVLNTDTFAARSESAQASGFPVENLYDNKRRSKVYRSAGGFIVDDTNDTIIIQETTGVDLEVTIAQSNYATGTNLATALETSLNAAGSSTYTVTYSSTTNLFTILSNGVGGGGIFTISWLDDRSYGAGELLGFDTSADDSGSLSYVGYIERFRSQEYMVWDFGLPVNPEGFYLFGQRNTPLNISDNAIIRLEGNTFDRWDLPEFSTTLTFNSAVIHASDSTGLHTDPLRFWRLWIDDQRNLDDYIQIGSLFFGEMFQPVRGGVQFPLRQTAQDFSRNVISESGVVVSDTGQRTARYDLDWFGLTIAEKEELEQHFEDFGTALPWPVEMDPDEAFSTTQKVLLVKYEREPEFRLESPGNFRCTMQVREEL